MTTGDVSTTQAFAARTAGPLLPWGGRAAIPLPVPLRQDGRQRRGIATAGAANSSGGAIG